MDKNAYLIAVAEGPRSDFGRTDFADQSHDQQVFSAVWALESEVNGGGFASYFSCPGGDTAHFAPEALEEIGASSCAEIVRKALLVASPSGLPRDCEASQALIAGFTDAQRRALDDLDSEFLSYPDNLTERLFDFVGQKPGSFGRIIEIDPPRRLTGEEVIPVPPWVPRAIGWFFIVCGALGALLTTVFLLPSVIETLRVATEPIEYVASALLVVLPLVLSAGAFYFGMRLRRDG